MDEIKNNRVTVSGIAVGSQAFHDWLRERKIFRYWADGKFVDVRRKVAANSTVVYWYAYRHLDGVTRQEYIGKTPEICANNLYEALQKCNVPGSEYLKQRDIRRVERQLSELSSEAHLLINKLSKLMTNLRELKIIDELYQLELENNALRETLQLIREEPDTEYSNII